MSDLKNWNSGIKVESVKNYQQKFIKFKIILKGRIVE